MVIGIDAHKRSHTAVTVDEMGRQGFVKTAGTTTQDHLRLLKWAVSLAVERLGASGLDALSLSVEPPSLPGRQHMARWGPVPAPAGVRIPAMWP
jgi:hypothetical protein